MNHFKFNNQEISIPDGWDKVTLEQYQRITALPEKDKGDILKLLEIFTGIEYKTWFDADVNAINSQQLTLAFSWVFDLPAPQQEFPSEIKIGEKSLPIPTDLGLKTIGQKQHFEILVLPKVKKGDHIAYVDADIADIAVAIYMEPVYSGSEKYNGEQMEKVAALIRKSNAIDVLRVANFFLRKYFGSLKKNPNSNIQGTRTTNRRQKASSKTSRK